MQQACRVKIQNLYPRLTPVEKKVADSILIDPSQVIRLTIGELAAKAGVAPSGVVRFCQRVGYAGFMQLKVDLMSQPEAPRDIILPAVHPDDTTETVLEKVFQSSVQTLSDTLALIDRIAFSRAVDLLSAAGRIDFYGVGTSATIATDAYFRLMRIGFPATCAIDPLIMRVAASGLSAGQAAVGISHSGQTQETIDAVRLARSRGAATIVITSHPDSPICQFADIALYVFSEENRYPIEAVSARIAHIAVLDALCVALSLRHDERTSEHVRMMNQLFAGLRGQV